MANAFDVAIGPCVGPVIGGFLTVAKGWRWNFWFVAILVSFASQYVGGWLT